MALGETLVPAMNVSLSTGTWMIRVLNTLVTVGIKHRAIIIGLAATYAAYVAQQKAQVAWAKLQVFWSAANRAALANEVVALNGARKSTMLLCAAKNLLVGNLKAAGTAFKSFFAAMGPIGWATLAIGGLITAISAWRQKNNDAAKSMNTAKTASEQLNDAIEEQGLGIGDDITKLEKLRRSWAELSDDLSAKERFILNNKSAFEALGVAINNVNEADLLLIDRTEDFIAAMKLRAEATIAEQIAGESIDKALRLEAEAEKRQTEIDRMPDKKSIDRGPAYTKTRFGVKQTGRRIEWVENKAKTTAQTEVDNLRAEASAARADADAFYDLAEARRVAASAKLKGSGFVEIEEDSPDQDGGGGDNDNTQTWSLGTDAGFLNKRLALKQQLLNGEIATEEEYNAQLLALEIQTLQDRLAANKDSAEDRLKLEEQVTDKLLQQKNNEVNALEALSMEVARMSDDRVAIENANYEKLKRKYAGNTRALEALERAHQARLGKIKLDKFNDDTEKRQAQYQVERRMMESRHRQELESFEGSQRELRDLRKKQWKELNDLDEKYLTEMIAQLSNLVENGKVGDLEIGVELSDADKAKLLQEIADLQAELEKLRSASQGTQDKSSGGGEFWGLSQDEWEDMFEGNLEGWENWTANITEIVGAAADQMMQLWGAVDKFMTAKENAQLKLFEKNNDKKKKALEKRLNAGLITEAQYNSEVEAMDAEYDAYQEELQLKQAKRQKAMNITQAIINTALGVTMTLAQWGVPWGLIPAGIMAAMGAAEIALIAATPITTGAEEGGPIGGDPISVRRAQDGKPFRARLDPTRRGFVSSPTVIVAENGTEYVMPNEALQNPTVYPLLSAMEAARKNGTLDSLDFSAIYSPYSVVGRAMGGYIGQVGGTSSISPSSGSSMSPVYLYDMLVRVLTRLDEPLDARVVMLGKNGFVEKWEQYQKQKNRGKLG